MSQNLTAPVLVLVDPDAPTGAGPAPAGACLDLLGGCLVYTSPSPRNT